MTTKASVIIAVRRDDGTVEYYASTAVTEFRMRAPGWHLGGDPGEFNTFIVHGNNLEPWHPSQGMPEPPQVAPLSWPATTYSTETARGAGQLVTLSPVEPDDG